VRIGIVSDIHTQHDALAVALAAFDGTVEQIWCAGDIVLQYRFDARTIAMLRDAGAVAIQGNHDSILLGPHGVNARARLGDDHRAELAWLAALPLELATEIDGRKVLLTHGSPWLPHGDYLGPRNPKWRRADELGVDLVITGHTHEPMVERFGHTLVVNPGSVGEPRQHGDRRATFAVLDTATMEGEIRYIDPVANVA
jgi:putative phosphoesterase